MNPIDTFKNRRAPCGRLCDGQDYEDHDGEVRVTLESLYSCGCRGAQHEYHDGTMSRYVVRHDGHVLVDELLAAG